MNFLNWFNFELLQLGPIASLFWLDSDLCSDVTLDGSTLLEFHSSIATNVFKIVG